ncbi:MAG: FGGY-family carbohydrate kinase [Cyanobacteriota bacterium]
MADRRPLPEQPPGPLALGVDLGTSGLRLSLLNLNGERLSTCSSRYPLPFEQPEGWRRALESIVLQLPPEQRAAIGALALAGTSGTLLLCDSGGVPRGPALPYSLACPEQQHRLNTLVPANQAAASPSSSLARALQLLDQAGPRPSGGWRLRHQADWLMGWLLDDWSWGEEGNNLRLGWDLQQRCWAGSIADQGWSEALPTIVPSGQVLGVVAGAIASRLGLNPGCRVVAGSTDANAAVLAADPEADDGVTVLGSTLVLKRFSPEPIQAVGISCHRLAGRWLIGGASNAGGAVLRRFFTDDQLLELSRQIDLSRPSGLNLRPLLSRGERFPSDDPTLEPVLEPRPVSDALYLQALLEGLTAIETEGWQRLIALGVPAPKRLLTIGGGARNPLWRRLRQQALGVPVRNCPDAEPALGMARIALNYLKLEADPICGPRA